MDTKNPQDTENKEAEAQEETVEPQQEEAPQEQPRHSNDNNQSEPPQKPRRNWLVPIFLASAISYAVVSNNANEQTPEPTEVSYSQFIESAEQGRISEALLQGNVLLGRDTNGTVLQTYVPHNENAFNRLSPYNIDITAKPIPRQSLLSSVLWSFGPFALLIGFYIWMLRRQSGAANGLLGKVGGSKAKLLNEEIEPVTFDDVAGMDEAKAELMEVVDYLKSPEKYQALGGKLPKGILLSGSPGTGKTLTARAVAGEAGVPFFSISGSDFVEMFVGVGASRVRDMFKEAKKNAPCIIFIDEIDAVGRHRGAGYGGGNDEREQTLNQLLVEMDGFADNENVIIIAATNRPDVLDPALKRPGRFDRQVTVPLPDVNGREAILKVHTRNRPLAPDTDLSTIARGTPGFSGADLANLANEASLATARRQGHEITLADFEYAKDKIMLGGERRNLAMSEEEKKLTAYHEAGHALIAMHLPASDPIHKATIIPRGNALGMVMRLPERDRISVSRAKLEADLAVAAGGRIAEEMIFGRDNVTTGASSDIQMMTHIAKKMVTEWGLSEKAGMRLYNETNQGGFPEPRELSEEKAKMLDEEIESILNTAYETGKKILEDNKDQLERIAQALIKYETLNGDELALIAEGKDIPERPSSKPQQGPAPSTEERPNDPNTIAPYMPHASSLLTTRYHGRRTRKNTP